MKTLGLLLMLTQPLLWAGNESKGGDEVIRTFADGWSLAKNIVTMVTIDQMSATNEDEERAIRWFGENQIAFGKDLTHSPQEWVTKETDYLLCGATGTKPLSKLYLYIKNCARYTVEQAAAHFILETTHHFDKDERFSATVSNVVMRGFRSPVTNQVRYSAERKLLKEVERNNYILVKQLLEGNPPVDPNCQTSNGTTPILIAAENGFESMTELLLEKGAFPDIRNDKGDSALEVMLYHLSDWSSSDVAKLALSKVGRPKFGLDLALGMAVRNHDVSLLKHALSLKPQDSDKKMALTETVFRKDSVALSLLLEGGSFRPSTVFNALSWAVYFNQGELMRTLLEHFPDVNEVIGPIETATPLLHYAIGSPELLEFLIRERGADVMATSKNTKSRINKMLHGLVAIYTREAEPEFSQRTSTLDNLLFINEHGKAKEIKRKTYFNSPSYSSLLVLAKLSKSDPKLVPRDFFRGTIHEEDDRTVLYEMALDSLNPSPESAKAMIELGVDPGAIPIGKNRRPMDLACSFWSAHERHCNGPELESPSCRKRFEKLTNALNPHQEATPCKLVDDQTIITQNLIPRRGEMSIVTLKNGIPKYSDVEFRGYYNGWGVSFQPWCRYLAQHGCNADGQGD